MKSEEIFTLHFSYKNWCNSCAYTHLHQQNIDHKTLKK